MKKIVFALAAFLLTATIANAQTVSASSVTFKTCSTTFGESTIEIPENLFPYTIDGVTYEGPCVTVLKLTNARGCDSLHTLNIVSKDAYTFTSASGKTVVFSKGNLQFCPTIGTHATKEVDTKKGGLEAGTWRFAEQQYVDYGQCTANMTPDVSMTEWFDRFGFGTSGYAGMYPYMTIDNETSYPKVTIAGTSYDWGLFNAISNGGNEPGLWRVPTSSEYDYILKTRTGATSKYGLATVAGMNGLILLPDNWVLPTGLSFTAQYSKGYATNSYNADEWMQMELNGAIFLPANGCRKTTTEWWTENYYVTSDVPSSSNTKDLQIKTSAAPATTYYRRTYVAKCVRLVKVVQ